MARNYKLTQTGQAVQDDLNKIEGASIEGGVIHIGGNSITPLTEETDPTVPAWAKAAEKPSYTADEVGALPDDTTLADLPDDADHRTVSDAEKAVWDAKSDFSGDYPDLTNKPDLSQFITRSVDDLVNYYLKNEVYTKDEVADLLAGITGGIWVTVSVLPQPSAATYGLKIYLVPSQDPAVQNQKDEYITTRTGSEGNYSYAWELIGSTAIDLSDYVTNDALQTALEGYVSTEAFQQALGGKADKDTDAVEGNFAAFDSSGNPVDSGHKHSDYITSHQDISGKADKASGATAGNFAGLDANGNLTDSGSKASDFATSSQGSKADSAYQKPSGGIPSTDMSSAVQTSLGKADTALQSFTETDPTVPSWAKAQNPPQEIFWATYGTTTATEVQAALTSGLFVVTKDTSGRVCPFFREDTNFYWFGGISSSQSTYIFLQKSNNTWSQGGAINLEVASNKVTTLSGYESDTNRYPNTKAVADYVSGKLIPSGGTAGQVLSKASGTNYDVEWATPSGGSVTDVTVGGTSVVNASGVAVVPAIPTVEALTTSEIDTIIAAVV